jgi:hypothetical protein
MWFTANRMRVWYGSIAKWPACTDAGLRETICAAAGSMGEAANNAAVNAVADRRFVIMALSSNSDAAG